MADLSQGRLILRNEVNGMEHIFDIKGVGKRPLALEYITVDCQVGEVTNKHIMVPNYTQSILTFKVSLFVFFNLKVFSERVH